MGATGGRGTNELLTLCVVLRRFDQDDAQPLRRIRYNAHPHVRRHGDPLPWLIMLQREVLVLGFTREGEQEALGVYVGESREVLSESVDRLAVGGAEDAEYVLDIARVRVAGLILQK